MRPAPLRCRVKIDRCGTATRRPDLRRFLTLTRRRQGQASSAESSRVPLVRAIKRIASRSLGMASITVRLVAAGADGPSHQERPERDDDPGDGGDRERRPQRPPRSRDRDDEGEGDQPQRAQGGTAGVVPGLRLAGLLRDQGEAGEKDRRKSEKHTTGAWTEDGRDDAGNGGDTRTEPEADPPVARRRLTELARPRFHLVVVPGGEPCRHQNTTAYPSAATIPRRPGRRRNPTTHPNGVRGEPRQGSRR